MATPIPKGITVGDRPPGQFGTGKRGTQQTTAREVSNVRPARDPGVSISAEQFGAAEGRGAQALAQGLEAVGKAAFQLQEERQNTENRIFLSRERSRLNQEVSLLRQENPGMSWDDMQPLMSEAQQRVRDELLQQYRPDGDTIRIADANGLGVIEQQSIAVVAAHHNARISNYLADTEDVLQDIERNVAINGNTEAAVAEYNAALGNLSDVLSPAQMEEAQQKGEARIMEAGALWAVASIDDLSGGSAEHLLNQIQNPDEDPEFTSQEQAIFDVVQNGTPRDIIRIQNGLETRLATIEQEQDQASEDAGDLAFKEGMLLSASGELTEEFIEENAGLLSASQFGQLVRALPDNNTTVATDIQVFSDLLTRADHEPELVQQEAMQAYAEGLITRENFQHLMSVTRGAEGDLPKYTSNIRGFVRDSLKPNEFDYSNTQARKQQEALLEFDAWVLEHPEASFDEMRAEATRLVNQTRQSSVDVPPLPMGVTVADEDITTEVLNEAMATIVQALDSGAIDEDEAARQVRLVERWRQRIRLVE